MPCAVASSQGRGLYAVHFDDGQELDDVAEEEIAALHRFAIGDRVSVPFNGEDYPGTVDGVVERGTEFERQVCFRQRHCLCAGQPLLWLRGRQVAVRVRRISHGLCYTSLSLTTANAIPMCACSVPGWSRRD